MQPAYLTETKRKIGSTKDSLDFNHTIPLQTSCWMSWSRSSSLCRRSHEVFCKWDLEGAYNNVSHKISMTKFNKLGCPPRMYDWLRSFMDKRPFYTTWNVSDKYCLTKGVPQGSSLSTSVVRSFRRYCTDNFGTSLRNQPQLYTNDLIVQTILSSCRKNLQISAKAFSVCHQSADENKIKFSRQKTELMHFFQQQNAPLRSTRFLDAEW